MKGITYMLRHRVDNSTRFSTLNYNNLNLVEKIEDPEVDPVPTEALESFKDIEREPYSPNPSLAEAVDFAIALGRPLLLQGEPGSGKTRLAHAVAYALKLPLEECYIKSTSRAQDLLYTYDAVTRLYDSQLGSKGPKGPNGKPRCYNTNNYIQFGPLGRAIIRATYKRRSVVLIDEIDKADLDFPNDLLWELDRLEFCVAEAPKIRYKVGDVPELRPIIIVTHNEEKALPTAFLRRCIFHYVKFPISEICLLDILKQHDLKNESLNLKAIAVLLKLRGYDLKKKPGLSELLDWVSYLSAQPTVPEQIDSQPFMGILLKHEDDQQRAIKLMKGKENG